MQQGDFTELAQAYHNRPGYSHTVLNVLSKYVGAGQKPHFAVADVGAGTGKLTENLFEIGLTPIAVEPNKAMREEGIKYTQNFGARWQDGSGEKTGLPPDSFDWVLMGSSFHWVDAPKGLAEFHRILRAGGHFTAIWNPRNLESSEFHMRIEDKIHQIAPNIKRKSSGAAKYTDNVTDTLLEGNLFGDCVFVEARSEVPMSRERFIGAWKSVNDIQAQAGPDKWQQILQMIERECSGLDEIVVPYKTRSWTVRRL